MTHSLSIKYSVGSAYCVVTIIHSSTIYKVYLQLCTTVLWNKQVHGGYKKGHSSRTQLPHNHT